MLTQCPSCHTSFHVTGAILRAAHGQVRCGHCNTQFDAIEHLIDSETLVATNTGIEPPFPLGGPDKEVFIEQAIAEDITLEGSHVEISGTYRTLDGEHPHTQTIVHEFTVGEDVEPEPEPVVTNVDVNEIDVEEIVADDITGEFHAVAPPPIEPPAPAEDPPAVAYTQYSPEPEPLFTEKPRSAAAEFEDFDAEEETQGKWLWSLASLTLLLVLSAQIVNHYRQDLARRAGVGPYLTQIYSLLGMQLEPRWELSSYAVKQWGVVSDPGAGGTLRVRASIANNARFAQPYPLLKLTLEDRFGAQVGTREFRPEEYLDSASRAQRLLDPGLSVNADLAIVDPGEEAVGFHLNVCLPRTQGSQCTG